MSVEAHVAPGVEIMGSWRSNSHAGPFGAAANSWHDVHSIPFKARKGHAYLIDVTATGFMYGATSKKVSYNITVDGTVIVEQALGYLTGGWEAYMDAHICLTGIHRATADADATAAFRWWTEAANTDWHLDDAQHTMQVLDLGPQP